MVNGFNGKIAKDMSKGICLLLAPVIIGCSSGSKRVNADFNLDGLEETVSVEEFDGDDRVVINYLDRFSEVRFSEVLATTSYDQGITGLEVNDYNKDGRLDIRMIVHQKGIGLFKTRRILYNSFNEGGSYRSIFSQEQP